MKNKHKILRYKTTKFMDFIDITDGIEKFIKECDVKEGMVIVYSKHTTAAIRINEKEKGIYKDFEQFFHKIMPKAQYYHHNDLSIRTENLVCEPGASDCMNGHSHCIHLLMGGTSETIPIIEGKLVFGTFQRVFLIELDCPRIREILIKVIDTKD